MKILLTGANGNLAQNIIQKADMFGMDIIPVTRDSWDDIEQVIPGADAILHAAGDIQSSITSSPLSYLESNLMTTANLLELSVKYSVSKFYFVSSCAVYGDVNRASEDHICQPISINGKLKKLNEDIISEFCYSNGINFSCFRVFNTFGGNDRFSIVNFLTKAARNEAVFNLNNDGISQRDFIHVADVSKIIYKIIQSNVFPPIVNIGSGKSIKIVDLFNVVKKNHPETKVNRTFRQEIEYSRSDTTLLIELIKEHDLISIVDYVNRI